MDTSVTCCPADDESGLAQYRRLLSCMVLIIWISGHFSTCTRLIDCGTSGILLLSTLLWSLIRARLVCAEATSPYARECVDCLPLLLPCSEYWRRCLSVYLSWLEREDLCRSASLLDMHDRAEMRTILPPRLPRGYLRPSLSSLSDAAMVRCCLAVSGCRYRVADQILARLAVLQLMSAGLCRLAGCVST